MRMKGESKRLSTRSQIREGKGERQLGMSREPCFFTTILKKEEAKIKGGKGKQVGTTWKQKTINRKRQKTKETQRNKRLKRVQTEREERTNVKKTDRHTDRQTDRENPWKKIGSALERQRLYPEK